MKIEDLHVGDFVKLRNDRNEDWWNHEGEMDCYCGKVVQIRHIGKQCGRDVFTIYQNGVYNWSFEPKDAVAIIRR